MGELGEFFGGVILFFYALTIVNFVLKFGLKHAKVYLQKNKNIYDIYLKLTRFFFRYHRFFGYATIGSILIHFLLVFFTEGIKISGIIAALFMLAQVLLGLYGQYKKPRTKSWLWSHRILAIGIFIAIIIHVA